MTGGSALEPPDAVIGPGVVVQVNSGNAEHLLAVLRNVTNLIEDLPAAAQVEVVAHGAGLDLVLTGGPAGEQLRQLQATGRVRFLGCANSLRARNLPVDALAPGIGVVPAAVGYLTRRQWQGWAYLHP